MRFLFVDRIVELSSSNIVRGIKHITADDYFLQRDEQGRYCFISSLIGESLGQLAAWKVLHDNQFTLRPVAGVVSSARLLRKAYLGETLLLESIIDNADTSVVQYHSVARVGDEPVFIIDGALGPLLPMADFIAEEEVKRQFNEIMRPGDWSREVAQVTPAAENELIAQMPQAIAPVMLFDRMLENQPGIQLVAEKRITRAAAYFPDHFPRNPVLPLTVLLECKLNLVKQFLAEAHHAATYQVHELRKIKMNAFVHPGDVILCKLTVKQRSHDGLILNLLTEVAGKRVCVLDIIVSMQHE